MVGVTGWVARASVTIAAFGRMGPVRISPRCGHPGQLIMLSDFDGPRLHLWQERSPHHLDQLSRQCGKTAQRFTSVRFCPRFSPIDYLSLILRSAFSRCLTADLSPHRRVTDICDNSFSGTIPSAWAMASAYISLSYNVPLVGSPPNGLAIWTGNCGYNYQGTSVGLDTSMGPLMNLIGAALDPAGAVIGGTLTGSWQLSSQPCPPFAGQPGSLVNGVQARRGYGGSFTGVTCGNTATSGGITQIILAQRTPALAGIVPYELSLLRTLTYLDLSRNVLTGAPADSHVKWLSPV